ncbi:hypothetical protein A0O21_00500 [Streptococcus pantholopis]|uniref:Isochorismatase-like domain-containing protein n=2 Tax=Streptococcus pantholopis TaxID=1811193 RepID=A0A172Q569_9STRE|nr:hypothetical protein A0O21_00500 [Streptococcus pantholopis]
MDLGVKLLVLDVQKAFIHQSYAIFAKEKSSSFKPIADEQIHLLSLKNSRAFLADLGISGEILHISGHSQDSVSLLMDSGEALVGDLYPFSQAVLYDKLVLTAAGIIYSGTI